MSLYRRAAKRDSNEAAIIDALLAYGFSVQRLSATGCPDLVIGRGGIARLAEVKRGRQPLRPAQAAWWRDWRGGSLLVLRDVEEVGIVARHWDRGDWLDALFRYRASQVTQRKVSA